MSLALNSPLMYLSFNTLCQCYTVSIAHERLEAIMGSGDLDKDWSIEPITSKDSAGNLVITGLSINAKSEKAKKFGLTSNVIRRIRINDLLENKQEENEDTIYLVMRDLPEGASTRKEWLSSIKGQWPGVGQKSHPDWLYARVAFYYTVALKLNPKSPVSELAEMLDVNVETAARRVNKARQLKLLTRPLKVNKNSPSGKSSGSLTSRCIEILNEDMGIEL